MTYTDIYEGEVLWINPWQWRRPGASDGFPFRAVRFAGRDPASGQIWVRGHVLDPDSGVVLADLTLLLPVNQPRARRRRGVLEPNRPVPAHPADRAPRAQRTEPSALTPPPGYRRTI